MDLKNKDGYYISGRTCFILQYHLVLITKYRHPVIDGNLKDDLYQLIIDICKDKDCKVVKINGEPDHVHVLIEASPFISLGELINVLKTQTSRRIRKKYGDNVLKPYYWKPYFWSKSSFICTVSEQSLEVVKKYIAGQGPQ